MPRRPRVSTAGLVFHVVNRAAKKARLFDDVCDYDALEDVVDSALARYEVALFAYCVMPNHWHLLLSPTTDGALSRFMHWLTTTHARRWQLARCLDGTGAVYQGRFKAFPVSSDQHFLRVARYVERNALRASLVGRAEDWPWSSLAYLPAGRPARVKLADWPVARPADWISLVNTPQTISELGAIRNASKTGRPYGDEAWRRATIVRLGLRESRRSKNSSSKSEMSPDPITHT